MPCPSFCGAESCGAVRSFKLTTEVVPGMIQVPDLCTCCVLVLLLFSVDSPLSVSMPPPPPANITRTAVQNVTSTSTQHSAEQLSFTCFSLIISCARVAGGVSSAQAPLGIINSIFAPNNHGPLFPAPFTCFSLILPCARVAGGVSRPRGGALCFL